MMEGAKNFPEETTVHIIPYAHPDYAWTHYRQWHIERYLLIINEVLDLLESNPALTWMTDNINHMLAPFFKYSPGNVERFKALVNLGRLEITNGVYALLRPTQIGEETFIRNVVLGKKFFGSMFPGLDIDIFHNVDVSIGHSQMPQVLKLAGYKFYRAWRPQGAMDNKGIPRQFEWEGLDGSSVICSRGTYAGLCGIDYMNGDFEKDWDRISDEFYQKELKDLADHAQTPVLWLSHGMDDSRLLRDYTDKPVEILGFIDRWNGREEDRLEFSTAAAYFKELTKYELPRIEGILDGCDVGYNAPTKGDKGLWRLREELDRLIVKSEVLWTFAALSGDEFPGERIEALWLALLNFSGHGMEFTLAPDFEQIYQSAQSAIYNAKELINEALYSVVKRMGIEKDKEIAVFNVCNWRREEVIPVHAGFPAGGKEFDIYDEKGRKLDYQVSAYYQGDVPYAGSRFDEAGLLVNCAVPPMGYTTLRLVEKEQDKSGESFGIEFDDIDFNIKGSGTQVVDNGQLSIEFREGRIIRISDSNGEEIFEYGKSEVPINDIRFTSVRHHEKSAWLFFNHYQSTDHFKPEKWHWEEFGGLRWKYVVAGSVGPHRAKQEIIFYKGKRHIDFNVDVECHERQTGFFSAAFPADAGTPLTADIPFGVEKRDLKNEPFGKVTPKAIDNIERTWEGAFYAKSWVRFRLSGRNISFVGERTGHSCIYDDKEDTVCSILTRTFDLSKSTDWVKDMHSFNECIGINNFKYSLYIYSTEDQGMTVVTRLAKEKAMKLETCAVFGNHSGEKSEKERIFFDVECPSAVVTAVYREQGSYILRLYEGEGKSSRLKVNTWAKARSVTPVDFLGNAIKREPMVVCAGNRAFETVIRPWEVVSFKVEMQ